MKNVYALFILIVVLGCKSNNTIIKTSKPIEVFRVSSEGVPVISAHRGGKGLVGYPENCLETMMHISDSIPVVFEIDIAKTKDNRLVLMHDNSIVRTTNGSGLVSNLTLQTLKTYVLKDDFGSGTSFKIPTLVEVLKWVKTSQVFLTIDIKHNVDVSEVIDVIRNEEAEDHCILITYDLEQAKKAYELAPELLLSVSARNFKEWNTLINSGIPFQNMLAFTGTRLSDTSLFDAIHSKDVLCILGTLGNLDRRAKARGDHLYNNWKKLGIDIIATDRPFKANKALKNN
ncbi:glycerophosphodiester phosphodiesterase family protein [Ichthyenterobacterium sp. W332]|uniref:Glycerophosphodiester phosphodiesterase family protein n=1 Tax=Microcosmobacter mediterraneus TaxID=3075607 RepID=A0ABU2YLR8_9FLAO|nr:glycerophosphodiester phosphodiesterase family protein [Ichthyenterobacterium sp. W332]MDT0559103.1 glycerophosphodiester phosphodiesterase family protein [Ichthyenterobacterium sp. W332]